MPKRGAPSSNNRANVDVIVKLPSTDFSIAQCNLTCRSDGGTRGQLCSGVRWIIEATLSRRSNTIHLLVAMRGKFLEPAVSSFLAEAIALEDAITYMNTLVA